jgi:hypothetical protein
MRRKYETQACLCVLKYLWLSFAETLQHGVLPNLTHLATRLGYEMRWKEPWSKDVLRNITYRETPWSAAVCLCLVVRTGLVTPMWELNNYQGWGST